jgi:hypothetical protein
MASSYWSSDEGPSNDEGCGPGSECYEDANGSQVSQLKSLLVFLEADNAV